MRVRDFGVTSLVLSSFACSRVRGDRLVVVGVGRGAFVRVAAAVSPEDPTFLSYAFMDGMSCDRTCVNRMLVGKQADRTKRKRGIHQELQLGPAMGMRTAKDLISQSHIAFATLYSV